MPILVALLILAACLPVGWPAPPWGLGPAGVAGLTAGVVAASLLAALAVRTWAVRALAADPRRRWEVGRRYGVARRVLFFANLGLAVAAVALLGWGWTVHHAALVPWRDGEVLAPLAELAVPLPYLLVQLGNWLIFYDAEKALHAGPRFWSRAGYVLHNVRLLGLVVGLTSGPLAAEQTLSRFYPEVALVEGFHLAMLAAFPVVALLLPLAVRPLLGLRPLPPGPVRDRVEGLARRLRFRSAGVLVWPTHGSVANALILGLVAPVRYVVFTDRLLDEFPDDERDAVFGHEVGHARHGHLWYYALFVVLSTTVLAAGWAVAARALAEAAADDPGAWSAPPAGDAGWAALIPVGLTAAYVFVVFGYLSRRCERQADVAGCRAVSCGDPGCDGHDDRTVLPAGGAAVCCPTGIRTFARALERVAGVNGWDADGRRSEGWLVAAAGWLRAWQHGPIPARVGFLRSLVGRPDRERRFQRQLLALRVVLMAGLVAALVGLGRSVGWGELMAGM